MGFCEEDPHPNPPHKGEGTLPHARLFGVEPRRFQEISADQVSLPLWQGNRI